MNFTRQCHPAVRESHGTRVQIILFLDNPGTCFLTDVTPTLAALRASFHSKSTCSLQVV